MNLSLNWFFEKKSKWQEEYQALRAIALSFNLKEELKWGCPCYTLNNANVFLIHGFKEYVALLFMKGAIMNDYKNILIQQTENVQSARQIRFVNLHEIVKQKTVIKLYIKNAIEVEQSGVKVEMKNTAAFKISDEFKTALNEMANLKMAFYNLTPGRQSGYLLYFSSAKQAKTRKERVEKCIPKILEKKGLYD